MMGRGGFRQNAGRKGMWENGETQTIRVPVAIKDELVHIGKELDQGQEIIAGRTCRELEQLLNEWDAKCSLNQGAEYQQVKELIGQIRTVLANRPRKGRGHGQGRGNCRQMGLEQDGYC
jgi:hypothetical protein